MKAYTLNHEAMERIITGFREAELELTSFELVDVAREGQRLQWVFVRDFEERFEPRELLLEFEGAPVIRLVPRDGTYAIPGDTMTIRYYVDWWWEGGGDDGVRLPEPVPGATLHWEMIAA